MMRPNGASLRRGFLAFGIGVALFAASAATASAQPAIEPYDVDPATALLLHLDGNARDASRAKRACTVRDARWTEDGVIGKALSCDGQQIITAPAPANLADGFTIEAWVRLKRPLKNTAYHLASWKGAFDLWFDVGPEYPRRAYFALTTNRRRYAFRIRHVLPYRRWCHVAFTYDPKGGKDQVSFLLHGQKQAWKKPAKISGRLGRGEGPLSIARGFVGAMDELRVSSKRRSPAKLHCPWPSGRWGDFVPFRPDAVAPAPPKGVSPKRLVLTAAEAVPTFNSIGLYVRYTRDSNANGACRVRYREKGAESWQRGMDLVPERVDGEFRGSMLMLKADTAYEIELSAADPDGGGSKPLRFTKRTWPEKVPIGEVRRLPAGVSKKPLVINAKGKPDAWILYAPPEGKTATIDAGKAALEAVRFDKAAYVILQGVNIRGGTRHAVHVIDSHHVRIRRCDISGYGKVGRPGKDGRFVDERGRLINGTAGVCVNMLASQLVIEDNFIHAPRGSANSWRFGHPAGPHAALLGYGHNNVIRNNEMIGGETHWWNDAIEGIGNQSVDGGPYRDTDIHGNVMAFANDNGVELDGGQINVRFWDNRMENIYRSISFSPCRKGPGYAFRNLVANQGGEFGRAGTALKTNTAHPYKGLNIILHNTIFGPGGAGLQNKDYDGTGRYHQRAFVRNDLEARPGEYVDASQSAGRRVSAVPAFVAPHGGDFRLAAGSAGIDQGVRLPGFNDGFGGKAPDMGAFEHGLDKGEDIPHRASGMHVWPRRVMLRCVAGQKPKSAETQIMLTIPTSAGRRWRAMPNEAWLRCTPAFGRTSDVPQKVTIRYIPRPFDVRLHRAAVVFRTDLGLNCSMMVDLKLYDKQRFVKFIEAESGTITGGMSKVADETASGGFFIHRPIPEPSSPGFVTLKFEIPADGRYYVSGRCLAPLPSGKHNSFFYSVDGEQRQKWNVDAGPHCWHWDMLYQRADKKRNKKRQDPRVFGFSKGAHALTVWSREPGTRLDRIAITNNPYPPE